MTLTLYTYAYIYFRPLPVFRQQLNFLRRGRNLRPAKSITDTRFSCRRLFFHQACNPCMRCSFIRLKAKTHSLLLIQRLGRLEYLWRNSSGGKCPTVVFLEKVIRWLRGFRILGLVQYFQKMVSIYEFYDSAPRTSTTQKSQRQNKRI